MLLEISRVKKYFPKTQAYACRDISLTVEKGEIFGLVGENGAGKSTLLKMCAGWYPPDSGFICWNSRPITQSPAGSMKQGVYYLPQISLYTGSLSIWENIILGQEKTGWGGSLSKENIIKLEKLNSQYDFGLPLKHKLEVLTSNQLPFVGLLGALFTEAEILLLDEPTAGLSREEIQKLFAMLKELKSQGKTILFISHKLEEVIQLCDRTGILVKGELEGVYPKEKMNISTLSAKLLEKDFILEKEEKTIHSRSELVYEMDSVSLQGWGRNRLENISFSIRKGEVLGIAGIKESGLALLEDLASGMIKGATGTIHLENKNILKDSPGALRKHGISYVPTQRILRGASLSASLQDNLLLLKSPYFYPYGIFHFKGAFRFAQKLIQRFRIKGSAHHPAEKLSGGNLQKVILSRELDWNPKLLILAEPAWGLDIATRQEVYKEIREIQKKGTAILLLTTDWEEGLQLSDRLAVLADGRLTNPRKTKDWTREELGYAMMGGEVD